MVRTIKYSLFLSGFLLLLVLATQCNKNAEGELLPASTPVTKINGISYTAPNEEVDVSTMDPISAVHANWISLMPFAFGQAGATQLGFNYGFQWWGERTEGIIACTDFARQHNINVMLKPHVWFSHSFYTGDFELDNENDWESWESNYTAYILHFARLADSLKIPIYCLGVEFENFIAQRPAYWDHLIDTVRKIYDGKLVYAANWDNYHNIPFWDQLDYIGIDAYFPVSSMKTPGSDSLRAGWKTPFQALKQFSAEHNKLILFTETGYKSIDYAAKEPWNPENGNVNLVAQQNATEAVFEKFWDEPWFAGGFVWKWYHDHASAGGEQNKDYTPQNKPAENSITDFFGKR